MKRLLGSLSLSCVLSHLAFSQTPPDAPPQAGDYRVTKIRIHPAEGHADDLVGGQFLGSLTSPTNDFELIAEVKQAPPLGRWTSIVVPPDRVRAFRFLKFQARNGTKGELAELEFSAGDHKLNGQPFATTGSADASNDPRLAFDGDLKTSFRGAGEFQQYVGLDLGPQSQVSPPAPSQTEGVFPLPFDLTLSSKTLDARILYSIDGSGRPAEGALEFKGGPIRVEKSSILQAVAIKPGLADSTTLVAAYRIGRLVNDPTERAEFHIGNSLTDTVNPWMSPLAASAGRKVRYYRFTIPGAPTDWLWDHPGSGFGESNYAQAFLARAPLTDLITQPFAGHSRSVDNEADYSGRFFDLARKHSPQLQMWLYVQWPDIHWDRDNWANGKTTSQGKEITFGPPAASYQEAINNHLRYTELVMLEMNKARAAEIDAGRCRPIKIIPGGLALARLKTEIEAGKIPGLANFVSEVFASPTDFHMSSKGAYLISLVHYACLYRETPEAKVTAAGSGLSPEQARIFQRIAWDAARSYKYSGLAEPATP